MRELIYLGVAALTLLTAPACRADEAPEDRLRDALRQSITQMRAAQDQAAQAQAELQKAVADRAALQTELDAAKARQAQVGSTPAAKPEQVAALQAGLLAAKQQNAALQQGLAKYQSAYQSLVNKAGAADAESRTAQAALKANGGALETCKATNKRLIDVSEQVLHLYESQDFRQLLLRSYEPLIGSAKVRLQNLVQDYDDKIRDQEYVPAATRR